MVSRKISLDISNMTVAPVQPAVPRAFKVPHPAEV
jgi:hypothetical protein